MEDKFSKVKTRLKTAGLTVSCMALTAIPALAEGGGGGGGADVTIPTVSTAQIAGVTTVVLGLIAVTAKSQIIINFFKQAKRA